MREKHHTLVQQATALGIPIDIEAGQVRRTDPTGPPTRAPSRTLREDSAAAAEARAYAGELIAFAIKFKAHQESGAREDREIQKGIFIHLERLASLGAASSKS